MKILTALTAAAVLATSMPAAAAPAAANPAAKLSLSKTVRAGSPSKTSNKLFGESPYLSVALLAGVIVGLFAIGGAFESNTPKSA